jgi:hypothetical protein
MRCRNIGGHYKWHFSSSLSSGSFLILPEGIVVRFCNFGLLSNSSLHGFLTNKNIIIPIKKKVGDPPTPQYYDILGGTRGVFSKIVVGFRKFAWVSN